MARLNVSAMAPMYSKALTIVVPRLARAATVILRNQYAETKAKMTVQKHTKPPNHSLLQKYLKSGDFTDCYSLDMPCQVTFEDYVSAFYNSWLFKLERWILRWAVKRPSSDEQPKQLVAGTREQFAAWDVEARSENQLLMCDLHQRTRSWLMTEGGPQGTRLFFGSAVVKQSEKNGSPKMGWIFNALSGFHALYSIALLQAAKARLKRS